VPPGKIIKDDFMPPTLKTSQGLTLLDMLVAAAVLALLAHLAAPAFSGLVDEQRRLTLANELASGLRTARLEAIERNRRVILQPLEANWANGWRMVVDESGRGLQDPANPVLHVRASDGRVAVSASRNIQDHIGFDPLGVPRLSNQGALAGTFHLCEGANSGHRRVVVARTGRVRVTREGPATPLCPVS
jgi:type IV fimbrial biogenesis protein FimT